MCSGYEPHSCNSARGLDVIQAMGTGRGIRAAIGGGWLVSILVAALLVVGCSSPAADGSAAANPACPAQIGDDAAKFCPQIVTVATASLGVRQFIVTSTTYARSVCPPNARCRFSLPNEGVVIFTFMLGDPVMVHVGPNNPEVANDLLAGEPEPLPDWLIDELAAHT